MNHHHPPKWADRLLSWLCKDEVVENVQGDLHEMYSQRVERVGRRKANRHFIKDMFGLIRPRLIKQLEGSYRLNQYGMFKNYFKIAWRQMLRQKMYSTIKVGGLAIGIAACLLIAVFIKYELSYDLHFPDKDRVYRVILESNTSSGQSFSACFQARFAKTIQEEFPEIEVAGRINPFALFGAGSNHIRRADVDQNFYEETVGWFDQEMLEILQPSMLEGDLSSALSEPNSLVLSKTKADMLFPDGGAVGQTLILNDQTDNLYKVGGVMEDLPENSHLDYDILLSLTNKEFWEGEWETWLNTNYLAYVKLSSGAEVKVVEQKLKSIVAKYYAQALDENGYLSKEEAIKGFSYHLQPISDIHLNAGQIGESGFFEGDMGRIRIFGLVAIFILLLACVNFINLSTAKSANRAKEIGLRKTLGSLRVNLVNQFLVESIVFSGIAILIGIFVAWLLLPYFNQLTDKMLVFPWAEAWFVPSLLVGVAIIGIVSGFYPALYLSGFKPARVLKKNLKGTGRNFNLRNALVVFQFATAIVIISGTAIVNAQMDYILNKPLGFEREQVVVLQGVNTLGDRIGLLKQELRELPGVSSVSVSDYLPVAGSDSKRDGGLVRVDGKTKLDGVEVQNWQVDEDYLSTMGMKLAKGRDFAEETGNNRNKVIINERLAKSLGLESPIGARLDNGRKCEVVGVVEDFHFSNFQRDIGNIMMFLGDDTHSVISVRLGNADMTGVLEQMEIIWNKLVPNQSMRYDFLDERFAQMYEDVQQSGNILNSFSILAILVACLGLFGLSAFIAEQRSKEISIRKVLGASIQGIFKLLTFNFLKLVGIAFLIATPLAWYLSQKWLEDFVYRVELSWWFFALAGGVAGVIALLTISKQALKVAFSNPVNYLKDE